MAKRHISCNKQVDIVQMFGLTQENNRTRGTNARVTQKWLVDRGVSRGGAHCDLKLNTPAYLHTHTHTCSTPSGHHQSPHTLTFTGAKHKRRSEKEIQA